MLRAVRRPILLGAGQRPASRPGAACAAGVLWNGEFLLPAALPDGVGSIRQWADGAGQEVYRARYDPFGVLLEAQGVAPARWGFAGEYEAPDGLIYLRARWYDPATGRFLTRDPFPGLALLPQTQHPYVYVANNPVNLTDPEGEIPPVLVAAGVGFFIGGVAGGVRYVLAHPGGRPEEYLHSAGFRRAVLVGAASGAVAGAVGFWVGGPLVGGNLGQALIGGVWSGMASGVAGQVTANLLTPCTPWYEGVLEAAAFGGLTGAVAGGVGYGVRQWRLSTVARLQEAATQADAAVPGHGAVVGTHRHTVFRKIVNSWGDPHLRTEVSFFGRREVSYGYPGSVRLDIVEYDAAGNIIAVYDYKTGNAMLTARISPGAPRMYRSSWSEGSERWRQVCFLDSIAR